MMRGQSRSRRTGGPVSPKRSRQGGFTLMEIALVALIVGLLSALAVATVRHLQERAARSTLLNNLRQLHEAKEHYFFESGANLSTPRGLAGRGYLRQSVSDRVTSGTTFEAHLGWHYGYFLMPGQPTYAYQGTDPGTPVGNANPGSMTWSQPTGEVIWYPGPPADLAASATGSGRPSNSSVPPIPQPPAVVVPPPVVTPPAIATPTAVVRPPVVTPPAVVTPPPVVVQSPVTAPTPAGTQSPVVPPLGTQVVNQPSQAIQPPRPADSATTSAQPNPSGNQGSSPGNSAFGHGQGKGKGGGNGPNKP